VSDRVIVGLTAAVWCGLHSWLVAHGTLRWLQRVLGRHRAAQRLLFTIFSSISLLAIMLYWRGLPTQVIFAWNGWWLLPRAIGLFLALYLFWAGGREFDGRYFLGLRQLTDHRTQRRPSPPRLSRRGILNSIRHPWYTGAVLFLVFCLPVTDINLIWRAVFIIYLMVGTWLEERKLVQEFGPEYVRYQQEVPMFLPRWPRGRRDEGDWSG
jgi:protein-S-isoprenylcysteine O-methyltransferase Ste14